MFISTNQLHLTKSGIFISVEMQYCSGQSWYLSCISGLTCLFYNSLLRTLFCLPVCSLWVCTCACVCQGKVVKEKRKNRLSCWFYKYTIESSLTGWRAVCYLWWFGEGNICRNGVEKSYIIHTLLSSVIHMLCFSLNIKFWEARINSSLLLCR